jgi:hypothetical protein
MLDNGKTKCPINKANKKIIEEYMKANIKKVKSMEKVNLYGMTNLIMKECLRKVSFMEKEF